MTTRQLYELLKAEIKQLEAEHAELLAALKLALPILESANAKCTGDTAFIKAVRAAIAKVDGKRKGRT